MAPWTVAHQAPLSMGILQARILAEVAMPSSRLLSLSGKTYDDFPLWLSQGWVSHHPRHDNVTHVHPNRMALGTSIKNAGGLLWWLSGKESACQCQRHGFHSCLGRPHMPQSN